MNPRPWAPRSVNRAVSSTSATIRGRTLCDSNQCSSWLRRAISPTGSIAGAPSKERGKSLDRRLARTGAAQITIAEVLRRWLNVLTRKVAALGVAAHECGHAIQHEQAYAP